MKMIYLIYLLKNTLRTKIYHKGNFFYPQHRDLTPFDTF